MNLRRVFIKAASALSASHPLSIFIFQFAALVALISQIFWARPIHWVTTLVVYFLMNIVGGTIAFHRLLTHRSFPPRNWFSYVGPVFGSLIGAGSTIAWVANHRAHHRHVDESEDPHSPHHQAWYEVMWFSMFRRPSVRFATDLVRSKFHSALHQYYWLLHMVYFAILFSFDERAVVYAYLAPAALAWNASSLVNWINHCEWAGYRNHETDDHSTNCFLTGLLVGGEGYHNNHHAHPGRYRFSERWFEFDAGGFLIKHLLSKKPQ